MKVDKLMIIVSIWHKQRDTENKMLIDVQRDFLKYTSQAIIRDLELNHARTI